MMLQYRLKKPTAMRLLLTFTETNEISLLNQGIKVYYKEIKPNGTRKIISILIMDDRDGG